MPMYCGVNGANREIKELYCGIDGARRAITEMWTGIDGANKQIFSSGTAIGDLPVGSIVKLKEYGVPVPYIVVHQGLPGTKYDASCDGTWLLREYLDRNVLAWDSGNNNVFENSDIKAYLDTKISNFDTRVQNAIKQVKIPYRKNGGRGGTNATGDKGLTCKVFILSTRELGVTAQDYSPSPGDGSKLSYFLSGIGTSANEKRRATYQGGYADGWWTRSPCTDDNKAAVGVYSDGDVGAWNSNTYASVRPAIILYSTTKVLEDGTVVA